MINKSLNHKSIKQSVFVGFWYIFLCATRHIAVHSTNILAVYVKLHNII